MAKLINLFGTFHNSTKRSYSERMNNEKIECIIKSKKYGFDYWDGERKFGYGGYKYIPGRLTALAKKIIKKYKLNNNSKILDIGAGKGYLLYEIKLLLPSIYVRGIDISRYAIKNSQPTRKKYLKHQKAQDTLGYKNNFFDLVISINCLHNLQIFDLYKSLKQIQKVGKKSYIVNESFRNEKELFNLQCWSLTAQAFFSKIEWEWILKMNNYKGDYEFIYFT